MNRQEQTKRLKRMERKSKMEWNHKDIRLKKF